MKTASQTILIALLLAATLTLGSASRGFWGNHGEGRRAEVAREVAASGNWLVPTLEGEPFVTKPPLSYWLMAAVFTVTGRATEGTARIPAVLATLATLLLVAGIAGRWKSPEDGRLYCDPATAGVLFASMPLVLLMGQNAETEPLLAFFSTLSVYSWFRVRPGAKSGEDTGWRFLFACSLALGFMVKGPLGWVFPLPGVVACELASPKGKRRTGYLDLPLFLLAHVLLAAPWFIYVYRNVPGALDVWLGESVNRIADPTFTTHKEPFWYYIPMLAAFGPVVVFLPSLLRRATSREGLKALWPFLWFAAGVIFLSMATSKRAHYLLSLAPGLALAAAAQVHSMEKSLTGRLSRPFFRFAGWLSPALLILACGWLLTLGSGKISFGLLMAVAGVAVVYLFLWRYRDFDAIKFFGVSFLAVSVLGTMGFVPVIDAYRSPASFFAEVATATGSDGPVVNWNNDLVSSNFYLRRFVANVNSEEELAAALPGGGWLVGEPYDFRHPPRGIQEVLRREAADPFNPSRKRVWALYRWNPAADNEASEK
ncbi:phospholipid carrier-dependent glycosyltransferase [bacterium]|nr:MAG: phospholipid carrier-dependent glycosyltransferase [bacterium]